MGMTNTERARNHGSTSSAAPFTLASHPASTARAGFTAPETTSAS